MRQTSSQPASQVISHSASLLGSHEPTPATHHPENEPATLAVSQPTSQMTSQETNYSLAYLSGYPLAPPGKPFTYGFICIYFSILIKYLSTSVHLYLLSHPPTRYKAAAAQTVVTQPFIALKEHRPCRSEDAGVSPDDQSYTALHPRKRDRTKELCKCSSLTTI